MGRIRVLVEDVLVEEANFGISQSTRSIHYVCMCVYSVYEYTRTEKKEEKKKEKEEGKRKKEISPNETIMVQ